MTENERVVERLIQCINDGEVDVMDELFHDDAVIEYPQSRERIVGAANRRAVYENFPGLPRITLKRVLSEGDLVVAELTTDYGDGDPFQTVMILELRDGRIARETAYWGKPFEPAEWRAGWVERIP